MKSLISHIMPKQGLLDNLTVHKNGVRAYFDSKRTNPEAYNTQGTKLDKLAPSYKIAADFIRELYSKGEYAGPEETTNRLAAKKMGISDDPIVIEDTLTNWMENDPEKFEEYQNHHAFFHDGVIDACAGGLPVQKNSGEIANAEYASREALNPTSLYDKFHRSFGEHKALYGGALLTAALVGTAVPIIMTTGGGSHHAPTPAHDYAIQQGVPSDLADMMSHYMDSDGSLDQYERYVIDGIAGLGDYADSPVVHSVVESMLSDGVTYSDVQRASDIDGDFILDKWEIEKLHTDPTKVDSLGLGIPDFHRFYIYPEIGNDPDKAMEFLAKIPNVEARHWYADDRDGGYWKSDAQVIQISVQDPQIESYTKEIIWKNGVDGSVGEIIVGGKPIFGQYDSSENTNDPSGSILPSEFFTNGRVGICRESSLAQWTILESMGYKAADVCGTLNETAEHEWTEVLIDGEIYVANYGKLYHREDYYNKWDSVNLRTPKFQP